MKQPEAKIRSFYYSSIFCRFFYIWRSSSIIMVEISWLRNA